MKHLSIILVLLLSIVGISSAQNINPADLPPIAISHDDNLQLYHLADNSVQVISTEPAFRYNTAWSPDGSMIAYTDNELDRTLYVYDVATETSTPLVTAQMATGLPLSWTVDGQILYSAYTGERDEFTAILEAFTIAPEANAEPQSIGRFGIIEGCGGGSSYPGDMEYYTETSLGGYVETMTLTPYGLVHSGQCVGAEVTLTDLSTGEAVRLANGGLAKGVVSPDLTMVAGLKDGQLVVVYLEDLRYEIIPTVAAPDQFTWHGNGALFYTTREQSGDLLANLDEAQIETVRESLMYLPEMIPSFSVSLHHVTFAGEDTLLHEADAYAIGRLQWLQENGILLFSQVENMERWIEGVATGTINGDIMTDAFEDSVHTQLYAVALDGNPATLILEDAAQFVAQPQ